MNHPILPGLDTIRGRMSVRTFPPDPLSPENLAEIKALLAPQPGPFGHRVRLICFEPGSIDPEALKSMGTYGIIKNAPLFMGVAVDPAGKGFEDLGYIFELLILRLWTVGYGTCWMGGTYSRAGFIKQAGLKGGEVLGAISPVGRPHEKRSFTEKLVRAIAGSRHRKPWSELFFEGSFQTSLDEAAAGVHGPLLEAVRLAPSASNRQPWRLVRHGSRMDFFLSRTPGYGKAIPGIDMQRMDMGIAMCHFECAAREAGIAGGWRVLPAQGGKANWEYAVSWSA